jgi:serine/threonine-protein kinase
MEFIDGESLEDLVARRAFTIEETLRVFAQICEAVAYIHRNGIVHRDIKSQNVKLTSTGVVKMLDFGIAKDSSSHGLTQTGGVIGTPHYLAPEQLNGRPASPQSDVWALGVLLYEMLTGAMPFGGETLGSLVHQISTAEFSAPENLNPAVSREVSNVVKRCLKKDTAKRFQTADELLEAIKAVLHKKESPNVIASFKNTFVSAPPSAASETSDAPATFAADNSPASPARKLPVLGIAVAAGAAVLLLFGLIGIWALTRPGGGKPNVVLAETSNKNQVRTSGKKVRVDVDEGQAQVIRDGQALGTTPLDLDASDGEKIDLTLRRDGFEDKNVQLEISAAKKVYTFSLKRK